MFSNELHIDAPPPPLAILDLSSIKSMLKDIAKLFSCFERHYSLGII